MFVLFDERQFNWFGKGTCYGFLQMGEKNRGCFVLNRVLLKDGNF